MEEYKKELAKQKKEIVRNTNKIEYNNATLKANHLPAIYATLAYLFVKTEGVIQIKEFELSPLMAFSIVYIAISAIYYKEVMHFSRSIVKKIIGLK